MLNDLNNIVLFSSFGTLVSIWVNTHRNMQEILQRSKII